MFTIVHGMRTIRHIIADAGGETAINRAIGRRRAASKWPRVGIPDRYWRTLMEMVPGLTTDELLEANSATRGEVAMNGHPDKAADVHIPIPINAVLVNNPTNGSSHDGAVCDLDHVTPAISREDAA